MSSLIEKNKEISSLVLLTGPDYTVELSDLFPFHKPSFKKKMIIYGYLHKGVLGLRILLLPLQNCFYFFFDVLVHDRHFLFDGISGESLCFLHFLFISFSNSLALFFDKLLKLIKSIADFKT